MRFPSIFTAVLFAASSALAAPVNTTTEDETAQIPAEAVIGYSDLEGDFDVAVLPFSNSTNNGLLFINTTIASIAAKEEGVSLEKRRAGTECRPARSECDVAEYCTGQSAECPTDVFHSNGKPCLNNFGYCYNGNCPIMYHQCYALFGPNATVGQDGCFEWNKKGESYFYCRKENDVPIPCAPEDIKCGRLFCELIKNTCKYDYSEDPDYGMVDHGTKCGDGKVCINRHCVDVTTAY